MSPNPTGSKPLHFLKLGHPIIPKGREVATRGTFPQTPSENVSPPDSPRPSSPLLLYEVRLLWMTVVS